MDRLTKPGKRLCDINCTQFLCDYPTDAPDKRVPCEQQRYYARLAAYEDTELTPERIVEINTFVGSQVEMLLVKNAKLQRALELACLSHDCGCPRQVEAVEISSCSTCKYTADYLKCWVELFIEAAESEREKDG